jgi:hypothetical protein
MTHLDALLAALRAARTEAETAYQSSANPSHERVVLGGVADDLAAAIAQVRDLRDRGAA